jgi:aminoglycoside phosphotransferase (APT) family kinase protein
MGTPGLDLARLSGYLRSRVPDLAAEPLSAELIAGGRSNLTYRVCAGGTEFVLRRPPLGHVLATAHDMAREHRVISALAGTPVPVPEAIALCEDPEPLGAPFYLMSHLPGTVYRDPAQTGPLGADGRRALADAMVDTLAALHRVDPDAVGLADFGHPEGYLARQVRRWAGQLDRSRSRELPGIDELRDRLAGSVPESGPPAIVHGDYRLDNLIIDSDHEVAAVLDWEMATLGDPLTDLGLLLVYWDLAGIGLGATHGFPPGSELLARYGATQDLGWYVGLGSYKLAVICEGIHYRYLQGQTVGEGFETLGRLTVPLVRHGLEVT